MACIDCECEYDVNDLSRLQVLTDLCDFAEHQMARGSQRTAGWARTKEWRETITYLKAALPDCVVEGFENERKRHREYQERLQRANR